ncbi:hypothetical protein PQA73_gp17 [Erwinia phage Pavtok]|uniref:Uncharacterized protein n=1 Tax=Erwinia phage Pavtok TaxID=2267655 RepID=A0A345BLX4_9CAUD|nr:hypothetical protein PQA73_gp17 [Erwinia phage Pavtok]AXF51445.1 hypothetical protein PAVTOK_17 [Erwinia phage Pavtok]
MSITIKRDINLSTTYGDTGITLEQESRSVEFTYQVSGIENFDGATCTAVFKTTIDGKPTSEQFRLTFAYTGTGSPMELAEPALQAFLDRAPQVTEDGQTAPETAPEVLSKS